MLQFFTTGMLHHLIAFAISCVILIAFTRFYVWFTPYNEFQLIREGHTAAAISLVGAMIGFTIPLIVAMLVTSSAFGFMAWLGMSLVWAVFVCVVQLLCFKLMYHLMPNQIENGNIAAAIYYGGASICVGALNAICIVP